MKKKVRKGRHWSFPPTIKRVKGLVVYDITFDESAMYKIEGIDRLDWNKLIGIKANFFSPRKNSLMIAWRANAEKKQLELTFYYHGDDGEPQFEDVALFTIPYEDIGKPIRVTFWRNKHTVNATIQTMDGETSISRYKIIPKLRGSKGWWMFMHWMGGTTPAVQDVIINYKRRK